VQNINDAAQDAPASAEASPDVMDAVTGLRPDDPVYGIRHGREKVAVAMQKNYDVFFDPQSRGLGLAERLLVALYASVLSRSAPLRAHYEQALNALDVEDGIRRAVLDDAPGSLADGRLRVILEFTRKLIVKPVEGDAAAIRQLEAAGLAMPDIVTLAQLVAFLSYQIRVAAGLIAMKELASQ